MREDYVTCPWCNKTYKWDWCQDEITGAESVIFRSGERPEIELELFFCVCDGTIGVVTLEPNGSTLYQDR